MGNEGQAFLSANRIRLEDIKYILHSDKKSICYMIDGRVIRTCLPLKDIYAALPEEEFLNIQKGIVVSARQIVSISDDGVYTMLDGQQFQGRRRHLSEHKRNRLALGLDRVIASSGQKPVSFLEKCSVLDGMPVAFCVIEMVFSPEGHGIDFICRYCNDAMCRQEKIARPELVGHSIYEAFENADKKWMVTYADVALNGTPRSIRGFNSRIGKTLTVRCYQPEPGYCACVMLPQEAL